MIRKNYCAPETTLTVVKSESSFCASSEIHQVEVSTVEVDEWVTIDNEVQFD